jgi:hypothetical protein
MTLPQPSQPEPHTLADKAEEVRAYVVAMRGGAPFLSAADGRLLVRWLEQGIGVARILAAVDDVATKRRAKRTRSRLTLSACKRSVEGKKKGTAPENRTEAPKKHTLDLSGYARELAEMAVPEGLKSERSKLVARIGSLKGHTDHEWIATEAVAAGRAFQEAAWVAAAPEYPLLQSQAESELQALKGLLKPEALAAYIEEVSRDIVQRRTPLVSAKAVWDRVSAP